MKLTKFTSVILFGRRNFNIEVESNSLESNEARSNKLSKAFKQYYSESKTIIAVSSDDLHLVKEIDPGPHVKVVELKTQTKGALISLAMCLSEIEFNQPLIIAAGDAISKVDTEDFLTKMIKSDFDAGIIAVKSKNPSYSYIRTLEESVIEVVEKRVISDLATTGVYYFKEKNLLVESIEWVISNHLTMNNSYYLSTAINYLISINARIGILEILERDYER